MDRENMILTQTERCFGLKNNKKKNHDDYRKMDGTEDNHDRQNNTYPERQTLYTFFQCEFIF